MTDARVVVPTDDQPMRPRVRSVRGAYRKSASARARLLDAAAEVFAERGFRNGSTAEIAQRAGISSAQVFYYFPNKEALLTAVLERRDAIVDLVAASVTVDADSIPEAMVRAAAGSEMTPDFVSLHITLLAESTVAGHPAHDYFRDRYRRLKAQLRAAFEQMDAHGILAPGVDPEYAATSTLALWHGIQMQQLLEADGIGVADGLRRHLSSLTTLVAAEAPATRRGL